MTLRIPNAAEEAFLDLMLSENMTLRLFTNDVESGLSEADMEALETADFTEATFTGYSAAALTGGSWTTTPGDDFSLAQYAQQTFTRTVTGTGQTIRGYYITRTTGGALRWYEYLPGPLTVTNNGDSIVVTPTFTFDDDREATVNARGIVARQTLTGSSTTWTTDATTDHTLANVATDSTRLYKVCLHTPNIISAAGRWLINFHAGGTLTDRFFDLGNLGGTFDWTIDASVLWTPTTGTHNIDVRVDEISGTGDLTFVGSATAQRSFWVEDVGPR